MGEYHSLYSYYALKEAPKYSNVPSGYIEIIDYGEKRWSEDIQKDVYGYVGYNRILTEMETQQYSLQRVPREGE